MSELSDLTRRLRYNATIRTAYAGAVEAEIIGKDCAEAADAIDSLRSQVAELTRERDEARDECDKWKALASQINTDWIPANKMLSERAQAAEARAEALQKDAERWQPIETAPKDGTYILAGNKHGSWIAKYLPVYQSGFVPESPWSSMMLNHDHIGEKWHPPTHWRHLPEPPAIDAAKEKA